MRKQTIFIGCSCLILLGFLAFPVVAAPVDCTVGVCTVSDGGASIETTSSSEKDLKDVFLNGIEHLNEDEFHICSGLSNSGDCEFSGAVSATMDETTNAIVVNFTERGYNARMTWTLDGSIENRAIVSKELVLTSTSEGSVLLTVLDYTGWDLFDDGTDDRARFTGSNILRQTQGDISADSIAVDAADFYAVHNCASSPNCEDVFDVELIAGNLNNNAGPVSPYAEYSWQNNVTLPVSGSVTINRRLVVTQNVPVPISTMSSLGLALAALVLLISGAVYVRRVKNWKY